MTNSTNPNRGHYSPSPTVTHGTKATTPPKTEDRKTTARKGGA